MKKHLEDYLWDRISKNDFREPKNYKTLPGETPRDVIKEMLDKGMIKSPKQVYATLNKWISKNKYNYGVSFDMGWGEFNEKSS